MRNFLDENFLLHTKIAQRLYHEFASVMPVIDYHNHLPPDQIAGDINFNNITQAWLYGDHYKWRAMRANGVDESYITGNRSDFEKFERWAKTVPFTLRNPLYHWSHLELQRYFGEYELLSGANARKVFERCSARLSTREFSVRSLLCKMNVVTICTTDDPLDSLEYHQKIRQDSFSVKVFPAFRPDKAMNADNLPAMNEYIGKLEEVADISIDSYDAYLTALKKRHDYFAENGCSISDHGLEEMYAAEYSEKEIEVIFGKIRSDKLLAADEILKFKSALLFQFALWDHEKGWVQQYHLGPLRNNNSRMMKSLGPDTGWDSIGDFSQAAGLSRFLNKLDKENRLTKTVLYNLNPADNAVMATMTGNFNDGSVAGKIQWGSGWWYMDQKDGMIQQMNTLSNMGLLSRFIGMLTDSRSFLSFPRHEYFRRVLCNLFGDDIENGELPKDIEWTGKIIQDICYNNAKNYFNF